MTGSYFWWRDYIKMAAAESMECDDFLQFQDALKRMRILDDKIIYMLNASIPTDSFKVQVDPSSSCKELYDQLKKNYDNREFAIKGCITVSADRVRGLKEQREKNDDSNLLKMLRKEQTKLRLLQAELNVEEVVKERTTKVYYERCRPFYKPPDLSV
ncbi:coiled-coil domain-containing protein 58 [Zootermopsis nevadensis]|uniref:Protein MIX23 n=1 Tax=Zootermopsis nevadensis TaxID=136037 RepID=A0A067QVE1_ZOONE|nr:coiled-coil domain-containing protein 58 [Zootermopsis nevadensis]KDR14156.1 Coiled-coil domain-containing protein 58 [Zootermopsis nevadensis]